MRNVEFINAGAGSGKTHKLVNILADYLDEEKGKYKPSDVILTTFTDLAAAEFREKAREALLKSGNYGVASRLETAAIGTIHSVAYGFVRKFWYLVGHSPGDNVMSESDKQFYINQSLANLATNGDILFFEDVLREFGFSKFEGDRMAEYPDFWKDHLKSIIEKMEQYDIEDLKISRDKSKGLIDTIFCNESNFDAKTAKEILGEYLKICRDQKRKERAEKLVKAQPFHYSNLLDLAGINPIAGERGQLPEIDRLIAVSGSEIRSMRYGEMLKSYIDRIFDMAQGWKGEFNDYKAKNRLIDYNDMERLFLELLDNPESAGEIRGRYKLVLVDEFQDSSPMQVKIFDRLSELTEESIWVGDPKQAIYGFRGSDSLLINAIADIFTAVDSNKNLRQGNPLDVSYRSRKGLVQLSNSVFERAFSDMKGKNIVLDADRDDAREFGPHAPKELLHWHLRKDSLLSRATNADHHRHLSQHVAELLRSDIKVFDKPSKSLRPILPEDIAILCRTNSQADEIAGYLREYGLKTAGQSMNASFLETAEVKLFLAVLNYIQNSYNDLAKAEILYLTDIENYPVKRIIRSRLGYLQERANALADRKESENPDEIIIPKWENGNDFIKKIDELARQIKVLPVPDLVEALIARLGMETLVSAWGDADRRIHNLDLLMKHAVNYDEHCLQLGLGASLNNFIVYLTSLVTQEEKAEKVKGAVNVLTYHKAKGLEWHAVILESLNYDELDKDELIRKSFFGVNDVVTNIPSGSNLFPERHIQLLPWFAGSKKRLADDIQAIISESEEFKNLEFKVHEEIKRLMYVGVTRARDYLITTSYHNCGLTWLKHIGCSEVFPQNCSDKKIDLWSTGYFSDFHVFDKNPDFTGIPKVWNETSLAKPQEVENFKPRYINPSKVREALNAEVTLLKDFNHRIAVSAEKNSEGESPTDAEIGTCLHDIFCVYRPDLENNLTKAQRILENRFMQSVFPEPERIIKSVNNLYDFLKEEYGVPVQIHRELPIQKLTPEEQIVRGTCDLVWETSEGCILVDYKSFQGGISEITSREDKHYAGIYAPQLNIYREVLEATGRNVIAAIIYYAVTGLMVELDKK